MARKAPNLAKLCRRPFGVLAHAKGSNDCLERRDDSWAAPGLVQSASIVFHRYLNGQHFNDRPETHDKSVSQHSCSAYALLALQVMDERIHLPQVSPETHLRTRLTVLHGKAISMR